MERFGRYVLLERIGTGGTAEVHRAAALGTAGFSRQLAIKRVLPRLSADRSFTSALMDEARIAGMLNHPNIVQVLDLGIASGRHFIAMEYVPGPSLDALVMRAAADRIPIPTPVCVHIAAQVARALHYAHRKTNAYREPLRIVHRDVTPGNIMVSFDGAVKLGDFGVAGAGPRSGATLVRFVRGKPAYMSPEQATGTGGDHRLDVYALGAVLYEMLALAPFRSARGDPQLLALAASGTYRPLRERGVEIPARLEEIVDRALCGSVEARWQDAGLMAAELEALSSSNHWTCTATTLAETVQAILPDNYARELKAQDYYQALLDEIAAAEETSANAAAPRRALTPPVPLAVDEREPADVDG